MNSYTRYNEKKYIYKNKIKNKKIIIIIKKANKELDMQTTTVN